MSLDILKDIIVQDKTFWTLIVLCYSKPSLYMYYNLVCYPEASYNIWIICLLQYIWSWHNTPAESYVSDYIRLLQSILHSSVNSRQTTG